MGYVDSNLLIGEEVVYRSKLHWIIFFGPAALFAFSIYLMTQGSGYATVAILLIPISAVWTITTFIVFITSEFAITNKRVLIKTGIIRRNSIETMLGKVEGIQVDQGIIGRMLDYGTIKVTGTGGTGSPFKNIDAPLEFRKRVQAQISAT